VVEGGTRCGCRDTARSRVVSHRPSTGDGEWVLVYPHAHTTLHLNQCPRQMWAPPLLHTHTVSIKRSLLTSRAYYRGDGKRTGDKSALFCSHRRGPRTGAVVRDGNRERGTKGRREETKYAGEPDRTSTMCNKSWNYPPYKRGVPRTTPQLRMHSKRAFLAWVRAGTEVDGQSVSPCQAVNVPRCLGAHTVPKDVGGP